jgi:hypothetical protein
VVPELARRIELKVELISEHEPADRVRSRERRWDGSFVRPARPRDAQFFPSGGESAAVVDRAAPRVCGRPRL